MASTAVRNPPSTRAPRQSPAVRRRNLVSTTGWALLPLRLFLGATFVFAGLQKLADPHFFRHGDPGSIQSQLHVAAGFSPIGGVLQTLEPYAVVIGLAIALGELAVGAGTLLGLWTRAAAVGGMCLSLGFLLAVSWHSDPYYLGADIVFLFAWIPLATAGAGSDVRLSLDARLRASTSASLALPPTEAVSVPFATVQRLCGGYDAGSCTYQRGRPCRTLHCPAIEMAALSPAQEVDLDRRVFLRQTRLAGAVALGGLVGGGLVGGLGRVLAGGSSGSATVDTAPITPSAARVAPTTAPHATSPAAAQPAAPTTPASTPPGTAIGPAAKVPVGGAARFIDPVSGDRAYVVQPAAGTFKAFDATCTHEGCPVQFQSSDGFVCPCHGAVFASGTGAVLQGPARRPLKSIPVNEGPDGQLYVTS